MTKVLIPKYSEKEMPQINTKISIVVAIQIDDEKCIITGGYCKNEAFDYYKKSAQSSNLKGQFNIRFCCQSGIGKSTNEKVAESRESGSDEGSKVGPICEQSLKVRSGMLIVNNNRKNYASLPIQGDRPKCMVMD
ncbi:hypothetical protein F8M41_024335 [Gigaspora margarita]|uniref:Uncharacterized protein n=1 Tax=Gigaspora margarita TaxID=4874 RepID=A0A8H4ABV3_GIGMA|nr:hypothetical protein F8M41_024335 [Gigaspora margarita]